MITMKTMAEPKPYVTDGDVGCGAPGSLSWHKCFVLQAEDQIAYIREALPGLSDEDTVELVVFLIAEILKDDETDHGH